MPLDVFTFEVARLIILIACHPQEVEHLKGACELEPDYVVAVGRHAAPLTHVVYASRSASGILSESR